MNYARLAKGAAVISAYADGRVDHSYGRRGLTQAIPSPTAGVAVGADPTTVESPRADIDNFSWGGLDLTIEVGAPTMQVLGCTNLATVACARAQHPGIYLLRAVVVTTDTGPEELIVCIFTPADHIEVLLECARVTSSCRNLEKEALWRIGLAVTIRAPTLGRAIGSKRTAMVSSRRDLNKGRGGCECLAREVVAPASGRTVRPQGAAVVSAG